MFSTASEAEGKLPNAIFQCKETPSDSDSFEFCSKFGSQRVTKSRVDLGAAKVSCRTAENFHQFKNHGSNLNVLCH